MADKGVEELVAKEGYKKVVLHDAKHRELRFRALLVNGEPQNLRFECVAGNDRRSKQ